jgi:hypothetical protein
MNPGMTTDWVLVMVSSSYNAIVDSFPFPVLELKLVARKDPEGENTGRGMQRDTSVLPMVSLANSEEPSGLQSRMIDISCVAARQALSIPPAKKRERIEPPPESKEWTHARSFIFHTLTSPFDPPDAKILESVREKDNVTIKTERLPNRILSASFGVRVGEEVASHDSLFEIRIDPSALPDARYSPSNEYSKQYMYSV